MPTLILSDFSKTLTAPTSKTTWSLFKESGLFPADYAAKRDELFETYRPFELVGDNAMVSEWFGKHLDLLSEYGASGKMAGVVHSSLDNETLLPREGLEEFLAYVKDSGTTLRIVSSGISELIQKFLALHGAKLSIGFPEKTSSGIYANDLVLHDGTRNVRTPADKLYATASLIDGFDRVVVLGDAPEDFAVPGVRYVEGGKVRGYSMTDETIVPGVAFLGKNASLADLIDRIA